MLARLLVILLTLAPSLSLAADGATFNPTGRSRKPSIIARLLCDSKAAAAQGNDCSDLRLPQAADTIIYTLQSATGCSAATVTIKAKNTSTGNTFTVGTVTLAAPMLRIVGSLPEIQFATLTTLTDCTDVDVVVELIQLQSSNN